MEKLRTALVGCGKVGSIHARALKDLPSSQLVAVCDADPARAQSFAKRFGPGARPFGDVAEMLDGSSIDVVCIATPHPLHAAPAIQAFEAGAHVLVEKPLAASLEDCDAAIAAARAAGKLLGVISQRRWYPPVQRMRAAIDAGKIGRPVLGNFVMYSWRDPSYYQSDPWRGRWDAEGGGVLVNQSPHMLDLLVWLMDDVVVEVAGLHANLNHRSVEVEDTAVAVLRFRDGGLGSITTSLSQRPGIYTKVHVHGSNGSTVGVETDRGATFIAGKTGITEPALNDLWTIPGEEEFLSEFQRLDRAEFAVVDAVHRYHALQIDDFLQAVLNGRPPLVTGEDGRRAVELFQAIYQSQRERRFVALPVRETGRDRPQ